MWGHVHSTPLETLKRWRGERQAQMKGWDQRGVSGEQTTPAPELTAVQPEVVWLSTSGLKVCGYPLCLSRSFLLKTEIPSHGGMWKLPLLRPLNGSEQLLGAPKLFFSRYLNKMERRWVEINGFKGKKSLTKIL